jgi:hypothetical protein
VNTTAMVLTISGLCLFYIPGIFGWIGIALAVIGTTIGAIGLTNTRTSPSGLGMDVASWVYGIGTTAMGVAFQIKYAEGTLDMLMLPISLQIAALVSTVLIPIFIAVQILARRRFRKAGIIAAMCLFAVIVACGWTALSLAHRAGILLAQG